MAKKPKLTKRDKFLLKIVVGLIVGLILLDLTPLGGNIAIRMKSIQCGRWPLQSGLIYVGRVPHHEDAPRFVILAGDRELFCTEVEAEKAGYSADPEQYNFPHLTERESKEVREKILEEKLNP